MPLRMGLDRRGVEFECRYLEDVDAPAFGTSKDVENGVGGRGMLKVVFPERSDARFFVDRWQTAVRKYTEIISFPFQITAT